MAGVHGCKVKIQWTIVNHCAVVGHGSGCLCRLCSGLFVLFYLWVAELQRSCGLGAPRCNKVNTSVSDKWCFDRGFVPFSAIHPKWEGPSAFLLAPATKKVRSGRNRNFCWKPDIVDPDQHEQRLKIVTPNCSNRNCPCIAKLIPSAGWIDEVRLSAVDLIQ